MPTKISWTDESWSPVIGCTKVSAGCQNCYAERMAKRLYWMGMAELWKNPEYMKFEDGWKDGHIELCEHRLEQPLHWRKPRRIFVNSMSDTFHPKVPFEFIDKIYSVAIRCPQHTLQILTKRVERMLEYSKRRNLIWPDNIIGMVTAENQAMADLRIPLLLQCGFKTTGVSIEPMLGPVDITEFEEEEWRCDGCGEFYSHFQDATCNHCGYAERHSEYRNQLAWVIVGGESGPKARPMHPDWVRSIKDQCIAANVPFFFKQWGEWGIFEPIPNDIKKRLRIIGTSKLLSPKTIIKIFLEHENSTIPLTGWAKVGKKKAGCILDGKEWKQYPERS